MGEGQKAPSGPPSSPNSAPRPTRQGHQGPRPPAAQLKDIDAEIPRDQMTVFCGPSGSGKTSLAMDTIYAEGQRRYVEA